MTVVLAVDPGASSGWAILVDLRVVEWGVIVLKHVNSPVEVELVTKQAAKLGAQTMIIEGPYKLRMPKVKREEPLPVCPTCKQEIPDEDEKAPYEPGWKTYYGMGTSRGRWNQAALLVGLGVEEVNPRTWQAATVGTGVRKQQIAKYRDRAAAMAKCSVKEMPPDAAAAVCIGDWWMIRDWIQPPWKKGGLRLKPSQEK